MMRRRLIAVLAAALALCAAAARAGSPVSVSTHNLSVSGPGKVKSVTEREVCIFCHGVHDTAPDAPLWNRNSSGAVYVPYHSTTMKARVGQPTGSSKLCLSCHDGTVALGQVRSRGPSIRMAGGSTRMPSGRSNLGTDLSDDHPISFTYDSSLSKRSNGGLRDPATFRREVKLDGKQQLQCTTCHDPHDNTYGEFLVMDNRGSTLCVVCHDVDRWASSSHRTSAAHWDGAAPDPWPNTTASTVAEAGCESCHTAHHAGTRERLLVFATEEANCFSCHDGHVARDDVAAEFNKSSRHDVRLTTGRHDPTEDLVDSPRHVECADCHNAHAANATPAKAPDASGALAGVPGITSAGAETPAVTREYELCYRCHGDSPGKGEAAVSRDHPETNTRLEFKTSNASYHPVEGAAHNPDVPSLVSPWRDSSVMYCTDCHNNDQGPGAGGKGPNGPHGSIYAPLLERRLELRDFRPESDAAYALCYKCHARASILADESFPYHRLHVEQEQTACTTCHDPHGVAANTHLINFNRAYVQPAAGGLSFTDGGRLRGSCTLSCHGASHDALEYDAAQPKAAAVGKRAPARRK